MATTATTERDTTVTLEDILLGTADDLPADRGLPELPDGWQHSALVQRVADAPAARREGLLALGFGLLALLWAPLGVLAVIAGTERLFLALSLLAVVALTAPRPTGVSDALATLGSRLRPAVAALRTRTARVVADFRAAGDRAGEVSAPSGLSDPLSRWVDGQSTPSSSR